MKTASQGAAGRSTSIGCRSSTRRPVALAPWPRRPLFSSAPAASKNSPLSVRGRDPCTRAPCAAVAATRGKQAAAARGDDEGSSDAAARAPSRDLFPSMPSTSSSSAPPPASLQQLRLLLARATTAAAAAAALALLTATPAALAADAAKVGTCLLSNCPAALARCVSDAQCARSLVCLNRCSGRPDETACQIRCGDQYADAAIETFNACAVSEQKCVPQRVDEDAFPVPPAPALAATRDAFDLAAFEGRWYITAGLNPLFDTFDCQRHFFGVPEPGKLFAKINWRISVAGNGAGLAPPPREAASEGGGTGAGAAGGAGAANPDPAAAAAAPKYAPSAFTERSTVQTFVQDPQNKALLLNHGNEYLHYEDDWYILDSSLLSESPPSSGPEGAQRAKPPSPRKARDGDFVFVYYRGNNDAWRGYGGAVVYTRAEALPASLVPRLEAAAARAGLKWGDFALTDNKCLPPPPAPPSLLEEVEEEVLAVEKEVTRDARLLESELERDARLLESEIEKDALEIEREAAEVGRRLAAQLQSFGKFTVLPGKTPVSAKRAREVNEAAVRAAAAGRAPDVASAPSSSSSSSSSSSTSPSPAPSSSSSSSPASPSVAQAGKEELPEVEREELEDAAKYLERVEARYAPRGFGSFFAKLFGGGKG